MIKLKRKNRPVNTRLFVILLIVFVQILGASMVLPILPLYATNRFGMSFEAVTLLNASFFAAQFLAGPYIGRLSDKYGRVPVLVVSQIGTVISFIMLGLAQDVAVLFFARILDGITGGNIVVARAYVVDITPKEQRTQALGYIFAAFGAGFVFGPALGGIMAGSLSYEFPYFLAAAAAAIVVLMTVFILDESYTKEQREANKHKSQTKMDVRSVLANLPLVSILLITFGAQFAFAMFQSTISLFGEVVIFAEMPDMVEIGVGLLMATIGLSQIFTQLYLVKKLVIRFGDSSMIFIGTIIRSLSMVILVIDASIPAAVLTMFLFAVGAGMQMPALQSLATTTVSDDKRGGVMGLYQSAFSLAIIFGSAIAGTLFASSVILPYVVGAILFGLLTVPAFFLVRWAMQRDAAMLKVQPAPAGD